MILKVSQASTPNDAVIKFSNLSFINSNADVKEVSVCLKRAILHYVRK